MAFLLKIADQLFRIHSQYESVHKACFMYIVDKSEDNNSIVDIDISEEDMIEVENEYQIKQFGDENIHIFKDPAMLENAAIQRKIASKMLDNKVFILHGSVLSTGGLGYMFIGKSGVGKTTRTKIWTQIIPGSFVINGDKPFIRIVNDTVYAYGAPWCGKEGWNTNTKVPLRSLFLVERSDNDSSILLERMSNAETIMSLLESSYIPFSEWNALYKMLSIQRELATLVTLYRFKSRPTDDAIRLAYEITRPE